MKKFITIPLASAVSMLLLAGCANKTTISNQHTQSGGYEMRLEGHPSGTLIYEAIMKAGEANGLKMTEFKSNAIIAEKIDDDESASATVSFTDDKIIIMQERGEMDVDGLLKAIHEELQIRNTH